MTGGILTTFQYKQKPHSNVEWSVAYEKRHHHYNHHFIRPVGYVSANQTCATFALRTIQCDWRRIVFVINHEHVSVKVIDDQQFKSTYMERNYSAMRPTCAFEQLLFFFSFSSYSSCFFVVIFNEVRRSLKNQLWNHLNLFVLDDAIYPKHSLIQFDILFLCLLFASFRHCFKAILSYGEQLLETAFHYLMFSCNHIHNDTTRSNIFLQIFMSEW